MNDIDSPERRGLQLKHEIDAAVEEIVNSGDVHLPTHDAGLVSCYVRGLKGKYDVERTRMDTANAIDLLYVAYNCTPQEEGKVRVGISSIMNDLILVQQDAERCMLQATRSADVVLDTLRRTFRTWEKMRVNPTTEGFKYFLTRKVDKMALEVIGETTRIMGQLDTLTTAYDELIARTKKATDESEMILSDRLKNKLIVEKEIAEGNARRLELESLVADLTKQVKKFDQLARKFESRAQTAETRAFAMSIVKVVAQTIASAIPPIAMASAGPSSVMASAGQSAMGRGGESRRNAGGKGANTAEDLKVKKDIARKKTQLAESNTKIEGLQTKIKTLEAKRDDLVAVKDDSEHTEEVQGTTKQANSEVAAIDERVKAARTELRREEGNYSTLAAALSGLEAGLNKLSEGLKEMSDEQRTQAGKLQELQLDMIDKSEQYENSRRESAGELVKINALLTGKKTEQENVILTIKSLNLSVAALKRAREIMEELKSFFSGFQTFLTTVTDHAARDIKDMDEQLADATALGDTLEEIVRTTDGFFIRHTAEWHAVREVSDTFVVCFADSWVKLNSLSGTYIKGDELEEYMAQAASTLTRIYNQRERASSNKLLDLGKIRMKVNDMKLVA